MKSPTQFEKMQNILKVRALVANKWNDLRRGKPISEGLAFLGGVLYLCQSWIYAHTQTTVLDEGSYLLKGYLYALGKYWPFQDYGPWSNHMPLSFLIPGYVQILFGPGLRTGRYFAIFLGCLMLVGLYLLVRRLGGKWWACGAVLAVALNPAEVKIYSMALSQVLVACLLVWTLALTLGEGRPFWQILLGSVLAAILGLTRLNLFPVLPLFVGYVFWQHKWRAGLAATLVMGGGYLIGHVIFWPGIMRLWATWIPTDLAPFLVRWRPPAAPGGNSPVDLNTRLMSFLWGIRFHFVSVIGVLAALVLWPKGEWKDKGNFRASVFLTGLFILLLALHAWASLGTHPQTDDAMGENYCIACFPLYIAFFSASGLALVAASAPSWRWQMSGWRQATFAFLILVLTSALGYAAFPDIGENLYSSLASPLLKVRVPRFRAMQLLPGKAELRAYVESIFGINPIEVVHISVRILPTLAGVLVGLGILLVAWLISRSFTRQGFSILASWVSIAMVLFLATGFIISPTVVLGGGYQIYDCKGDVISSNETVGAYLSRLIPPRALVYWNGGESAIPLLYLKEGRIFPPQINNGYTYRGGGDADALARYGFWNEMLARQWSEQADYILIEERLFEGWLGERVEAGGFNELLPTPLTAPCRKDSSIHIFKRRIR